MSTAPKSTNGGDCEAGDGRSYPKTSRAAGFGLRLGKFWDGFVYSSPAHVETTWARQRPSGVWRKRVGPPDVARGDTR